MGLSPECLVCSPLGRDGEARMRCDFTTWLAAADGIPAEVQHLFDLSPYERQAREILEGEAR